MVDSPSGPVSHAYFIVLLPPLGQSCLQVFLCLYDLDLFSSMQLFYKMSYNFSFSDVFHIYITFLHLGPDFYIYAVIALLFPMLGLPVIGEVKFDHLVQVMSLQLLLVLS